MSKLHKVCILYCALFILKTEASSNSSDETSEQVDGGDPLITNIAVDKSLPRYDWMSRIFYHHGWNADYARNASRNCRTHVMEYVTGLQRGSSWATKMNDASGRYAGQFFFGNDFWLGSSSLCWELTNRDTNPTVPPFPVRFAVAKIHLMLTGNEASTSRHLMLGQCLPTSCDPDDIKSILGYDVSHIATPNTSLEVANVRAVPGDYNLFEDVKFYIIGGVTVAMLTIISAASLYEVYSEQKKKTKSDEEKQNSTNNNNEIRSGEVVFKESARKADKSKIDVVRGLPSKMLLCFSAISNGKKILSIDNVQEDSIKCIHGLRFLSVAWVILVHTYLQAFSIAENKTVRIITERFFVYQTISNATFSVDSFFFISGFLVTILYFRTAKKSQPSAENEKTSSCLSSVKRFLFLVFYRFVRLTPAYLFVLGVHEVVIRYFHNSSVFEPGLYDHVTCDNYWWRNALYINTWYPQREICMLWSWYMSNDTQFYVMAVIILLIAVRGDRYFKLAVAIVAVFMVTSWVATFAIAYEYKYQARIEEPFALFDQLYDKPWMRVGPYLVGMAAGWILFRTNCKVRMPTAVWVSGWVGCFAILLSLVYGLGKDGLQVPLSAFYASLGHTAWGLALGWITLACCTGYGGVVNHLLSFSGFLPLSRLTYCAYLVHPMLQCVISFQMDGPLHLHNAMVLVIYLGNVVIAFIMSFLISLGFEAPVVRLLKILMEGRSKDD